MGDTCYFPSDRKLVSSMKNNEANASSLLVSSVPNCEEGCVWRTDLIISLGSGVSTVFLTSQFWKAGQNFGGNTPTCSIASRASSNQLFRSHVLHRHRVFCLQVPITHQQKSNPPLSNGMLPLTVKAVRGKCSTASTLLELIKDVEIAISSRKGRTGTAAGDVAFPKGKENLAYVLKRYKRRLSPNKLVGNQDGPGSRKITSSGSYNQ